MCFYFGIEMASKRDRKLQSLLELGHLIGLDLKIDEMLYQIAQKAAEVMEADRCTLFLHDATTNELWSTVAMGLKSGMIRMPSTVGVAGACFQTARTINLENAYEDPRFNPEVDLKTGYQTRSILCIPLYNRAGQVMGVIQLLNKKGGVFNREDETFLKAFGNQASVFIEMAQLQKARIEALEASRQELEHLNRVKDKVLDHLSHELKTPLAVIMGALRLLKKKLHGVTSPSGWGTSFEMLDKHLNRLLMIQQEADEIVRSYRQVNLRTETSGRGEVGKEEKDVAEMESAGAGDTSEQPVQVFSIIRESLAKANKMAGHRQISFSLEGEQDISVHIDPRVLEQAMEGLLKNAIENTPDEGAIRVVVENRVEGTAIRIRTLVSELRKRTSATSLTDSIRPRIPTFLFQRPSISERAGKDSICFG